MMYIKDGRTFVTKWYGEYISYSNLPLFSDDNSSGTIVIPGKNVPILQKDIVLMDGRAWVVDSTSPDESSNTISITVKDVLNLFDYIYPDNHKGHAHAETYLSNIINYHYRENADPVYRKAYVHATPKTEVVNPIPPTLSEETLFNENEYFRKCGTQTNGVRYEVTYTNTELNIEIEKRSNSAINICLGDGHHIFVSREFDKNMASKISVAINGSYTPSGSQTPVKYTDGSTAYPISYLLDTTGSLYRSDRFPSDKTRAEGRWIVREINVTAAPYDKTKTYSVGSYAMIKSGTNSFVYRAVHDVPVRSDMSHFYSDDFQRYAEYVAYSEVSNNVYNYKVEFDSDYIYKWQDRVKIRFEDGMVFSGIITSVTMDSESNLYHYRVGNLPNTVTEKLKKQMSENKTSLSVTNKTEIYNSGSSESISYSEIQGILSQ